MDILQKNTDYILYQIAETKAQKPGFSAMNPRSGDRVNKISDLSLRRP